MKIETKFDIGQEVYAYNVYRQHCIDKFSITEICYSQDYGIYYKTDMGIDLFEYYFDISATREETELKLKESVK